MQAHAQPRVRRMQRPARLRSGWPWQQPPTTQQAGRSTPPRSLSLVLPSTGLRCCWMVQLLASCPQRRRLSFWLRLGLLPRLPPPSSVRPFLPLSTCLSLSLSLELLVEAVPAAAAASSLLGAALPSSLCCSPLLSLLCGFGFLDLGLSSGDTLCSRLRGHGRRRDRPVSHPARRVRQRSRSRRLCRGYSGARRGDAATGRGPGRVAAPPAGRVGLLLGRFFDAAGGERVGRVSGKRDGRLLGACRAPLLLRPCVFPGNALIVSVNFDSALLASDS